jgi:hypothetical protein
VQSIQLYIGNERVELFDDESISLTQTIQNVRDIGSIFTDFSQSFSVPASKTNNKIFKHYYNYDIDPTTGFNANDLVSATIELNYRTFRKGFIALDGTQMKDNKAYAYKITFFGETIDLKNKLKETKLSTVFQGVNTYDHSYNVSNVKTGLETSLSSGAVRYPLISHTERFFYDSGTHTNGDRNLHYDEGGGGSGSHNHGVRYTDLKPALKLTKIIEEIENYADIEFTKTAADDFFNTTVAPSNSVFDSLYLWLSRVKGALGLNVTGTAQIDMPITSISFQNANPGQWLVEFQGSSSGSSPYSRVQNGIWTCRPQQAYFGTAGHYYEATFTVVTSSQVTILGEDVTSTPFTIASATGTGTVTITIPVYTNSIFGQLRDIRFRVTSTDPAVSFTPTINFLYRHLPVNSAAVNYYTEVTGSDIQPNGAVSNIVISDQMPDIKVIDFLTGIFKMFNLTAYVQNDGKIKVMTLDDFYDSGTDYDISEFVDSTESEVDFAIPYQEIAFRFQEPNTFLAVNFKELFNKTFGDLENTTTESPDVQTTNRGNKYVVQLPFGKMLYERINDIDTGSQSEIGYGYCVDKDQNPTNVKPLILNITNETNLPYNERLSFYNGSSTGTAARLTQYNRPSNTYSTAQSLHFGEEVDEYFGQAEDDSLFENYYKNYIVDTFNQQRRLTKVSAYLPLRILLNYTLADRFIINGRSFRINSIKTNLKSGKSELELLNEV